MHREQAGREEVGRQPVELRSVEAHARAVADDLRRQHRYGGIEPRIGLLERRDFAELRQGSGDDVPDGGGRGGVSGLYMHLQRPGRRWIEADRRPLQTLDQCAVSQVERRTQHSRQHRLEDTPRIGAGDQINLNRRFHALGRCLAQLRTPQRGLRLPAFHSPCGCGDQKPVLAGVGQLPGPQVIHPTLHGGLVQSCRGGHGQQQVTQVAHDVEAFSAGGRELRETLFPRLAEALHDVFELLGLRGIHRACCGVDHHLGDRVNVDPACVDAHNGHGGFSDARRQQVSEVFGLSHRGRRCQAECDHRQDCTDSVSKHGVPPVFRFRRRGGSGRSGYRSVISYLKPSFGPPSGGMALSRMALPPASS